MRYEERDDRELLELAAAGWAPAYAVLVHRHAPHVLAAHAGTDDAYGRTLATLTAAMRALPDRDPSAPIGPWLLALTGRPAPTAVPPVDDATIDQLWHDLQARWPDGRVHHRWPTALSRALVVAAAIGVGVAVPVAVLSVPGPVDDGVPELRAQPLPPEERPDPPVEQIEEVEELPSFEFPDVDPTPPPPPPPPPATEPEPEPAPEPEPEPEPEPTEDDLNDGSSDDGPIDDLPIDDTDSTEPDDEPVEDGTDGDPDESDQALPIFGDRS